jgi:glycosyltransferase involved in cell wall biosynthesis
MKISWITRSFLDYRIPVYAELDRLCGNNLTVIYYSDVVPERCIEKLKTAIGKRAIGLTGELRISGKKKQPLSSLDKRGTRIPFQPGLIREIKRSHPDIMVSDGFFQWTFAPLWLRLTRKIPLVMCYEGTKHTERNGGFFRILYRKNASRLIDHIVCNGRLCSEYIKELDYPKNRISIGNMAADTKLLYQSVSDFSAYQRLKLKDSIGLNQNVVLFIGRLVPLKGVDLLINVWIKVFKGNNNISLLIVGDGAEKRKLENICIKGDSQNIKFTGNVDYDLIYSYYAIADVFIIPTLQDNWSLVVPEAMSCALPIISSKYNGCWPELVRSENGWVFDPLNEEDFSRTLRTVWENKDKWKQMGRESLRIVQDYTPEKVAANIFNACVKITGTAVNKAL